MHDAQVPTSICFSLDELKECDEASGLTGPYLDDDGEFDITQICHSLDVNHSPHGQGAKRQQSIHELKQQIAKQQKMLGKLSSELRRNESENQALRAEKSVLVEELSLVTQDRQGTRGWISKQGDSRGGSMKVLINTNEKLVAENARLEVLADVTRKAFQSYVRETRGKNGMGKHAMEMLTQENMSLKQQLNLSENSKLSSSFQTAKTFTGSSDTESSLRSKSQDRLVDSSQPSLRKSLGSIPELDLWYGTSGNECNIKDEGIDMPNDNSAGVRAVRRRSLPAATSKGFKNTFAEGVCSKSVELLANLAENETQTPQRTHPSSLSKSLTEQTMNPLKNESDAGRKFEDPYTSEELLVDFGGGATTRRPRRATTPCLPDISSHAVDIQSDEPKEKSGYPLEELIVDFSKRRSRRWSTFR